MWLRRLWIGVLFRLSLGGLMCCVFSWLRWSCGCCVYRFCCILFIMFLW